MPYLKTCLAEALAIEALALNGDVHAALELIEDCLEQIERPGWQEGVHLVEIVRLRGWMLIRDCRAEEVETQLRASIDFAQQQAESWECVARLALGKLLVDAASVRHHASCSNRFTTGFTEGFDTKDLKEAKALLEELS